MRIDGACHCGRIRFSAEVDPAQVRVCHCTDCQVLSGAPLRAIVPAALDAFDLQGEPRRYVKVADSGARRVQAFCGDCGTPLFSCAAENPTSVTLRVGCIAQRAQLAPRGQIWCRSALAWVGGVAALPGFERQPPPGAAGPPASRG